MKTHPAYLTLPARWRTVLQRVFSSTTATSARSGFDIARETSLRNISGRYREPLDESDVNYGVMAIPTFTGSMLPAVGAATTSPALPCRRDWKPGHTEAAFEFLTGCEQDGYHIEINKGRIPGKLSLWSHGAVRLDPTLQVLATMAPYTIFGELPGYQWEQPWVPWPATS